MTGQTVGHYRIGEKLGEGGMGVVYKAEDIHLDRFVALKFLHSSEDVPRLLREAKTAASLNHPNICAVHEVDPERGFIAMELIEGESLAAKLGGRPLPVEKAVSLAVQICEGLEAAHGKGVIHRDIKSANLLVTADGQVKILDFGLARVAGQTALTRQGAAAGTPGYMAPEQMRGEPADRRTDIWAVGAVLHEMLTGRPPMGPVKTLPEGLSRIVRKALAADPGDRYQHIEDLLVDLRAAATPPAAVAVPRRWLWPAVAAVLLLAIFGLWLWQSRVSPPPARSKAIAVLYFTNLSQDKSLDWLDRGLAEMLTTNLSQVKGMDVLSAERIASVLGRLGKKQMSAEVAPEVARSAGAGAFVTGALMRIGQNRLRLDVRAQDSASGQVLLSEKVEGENIDAVFKMVDSLTARMAERFLPSGALPAKAPALEEVATSNVEAFRHYQVGLDAFRRIEFSEALRELEAAVRLDPQFALAWLQIAYCHRNMGEARKESEILRKLSGMQSRLPRKAQLYVDGARALSGYDWDGSERAYETLLAEFPRETMARMDLASAYWSRDRWDKGAEVYQEGVKLDPNDHFLWNQLSFAPIGTGNLAAALEANDRCRALLPGDPLPWDSRAALFFIVARNEEAIQAYNKSLELGPAAMGFTSRLALAFVHADQKKFSLAESTLREYGRLSKDPLILFYEAHLEEARGRLDAARELYRKAVAQLAGAKRYDAAGQGLLALAHVSQVLGDSVSALAFARQQRLDGEEYLPISFLESVEGDSAGAERTLQKYASSSPSITPAGLQTFRARNQMVAALQRNDARAAPASASRLPILPETWMPFYEARGALLRRDYGSAEHLLRRTLFLHRWLLTLMGTMHTRSPLVTLLCHFYLSQVYEANGKRDQAVSEYREFLSVFDGSATRLPQISEARAALKRLGAQ